MTRIPAGRRFLLGCLLTACSLALALVLAEASMRLFDLLAPERQVLADLAVAKPTDEPRAAASKFQLHPMLGRSRRPGIEPPKSAPVQRTFPDGHPTEHWLRSNRSNLFGFRSEIDDYRTVPEDKFVVGVFGGSVADELVALSGDELARVLEDRVPALRGRVVVLNFGLGGYKQPQQAAALLEMILLGVPLDGVVNLDGFNELALGAQDARAGHHPLFPAREQLEILLDLARSAPSAEVLELSGAKVAAERRARELARRVDGSRLGWSRLVRGLAGLRCVALQREAAGLEERLRKRARENTTDDVIASIPDPRLGAAGGPFELIADLWERGSVLMAAMAERSGAIYLHVLQPNQYVEGSKRLSPDELEYAYNPGFEWGINAREGYPVLQRRAERLPGRGIAFHDLTGIFADVDRTIYSDECCHLNLEGNRILARAIAERLADLLPREG